ncbi:hypothetical protein CONCODRAFT_8013 [Conidiobolus coronatus NRRL 28638]|uniref:Uncharacterized protein n=1 Tax=Conidiobolus coronatus (strain ATCC 28846 / CBS 209.66 / NRRL 28638) TaxID=796925 RepID=A0A137P3J3_CONC2|nr:hypothetical protein CONCODRAFT_8013 [Conidiobolus coronatus NRRL 28638]|eukprot:KXN69590.1 hypothetical protein CONCODRAFT_8013 [Conidiobolus coronatus NRRL 28638]
MNVFKLIYLASALSNISNAEMQDALEVPNLVKLKALDPSNIEKRPALFRYRSDYIGYRTCLTFDSSYTHDDYWKGRCALFYYHYGSMKLLTLKDNGSDKSSTLHSLTTTDNASAEHHITAIDWRSDGKLSFVATKPIDSIFVPLLELNSDGQHIYWEIQLHKKSDRVKYNMDDHDNSALFNSEPNTTKKKPNDFSETVYDSKTIYTIDRDCFVRQRLLGKLDRREPNYPQCVTKEVVEDRMMLNMVNHYFDANMSKKWWNDIYNNNYGYTRPKEIKENNSMKFSEFRNREDGSNLMNVYTPTAHVMDKLVLSSIGAGINYIPVIGPVASAAFNYIILNDEEAVKKALPGTYSEILKLNEGNNYAAKAERFLKNALAKF